jgi:hypothetical protein
MLVRLRNPCYGERANIGFATLVLSRSDQDRAVPLTVNSGFETLISRLTPTEAESNASSKHRVSVEAKLRSALGVQNFFGTGSSSNGTSVRFRSDADYFASIPSQNQRDNSAYMLTVVKEVLQERFPYTTIRIRTPAVVCEFGDSASETLEVVPAYYVGRDDSDTYNIYKIPQGGGGWVKSGPRVHNAYVTEINSKLGYKVKPLIRLLKAVKYYNNIPVSSFYLELRLAKWASEESSIVYSIDTKAMLSHLVGCELASMRDPKGISGYVPAASTENYKEEALSKLTTALSRAQHAREAEADGRIEDAFYYWDRVFNGNFPAYG